MMDKHGIKSLDQLSSEEKKRFFNAVDKNYKAKNEETLNENPAVIATAARMAIQNKQGKKVSVNTARQSSYSKKDPQAHKKAKSLFQKIKHKISKKDKKKSEPKKQSKSSAQKYADLYGGGAKVESVEEGYSMRDIGLSPFFKKLKPIQRQAISIALVMGGNMTGAVKAIEKIKKGLSKDKKVRNALRLANENIAPNHDGKAAPYGSGYEEMDEAKIQVQGIGMYDDKTLKKKIIQLASELQKNAKKGNWNKASENGIRALGRMWGAYQDYARNNESVNEDADIGHQDDEPNMLKKTSLEIMEYGKKLYDKLDYYDDMNNEVDFPTWWQAKLIISKEYLQKAYHYLDSEEKTDES